ncbi:MAG: chemotaxis protein CheY [Actinomycetia bacterium]|nr:chemotaxis protein CheY [Actinomycetes bacterium]
MRVLIVDDNAHFLEAARDLLEREGMSVVGTASTSAEAIRQVAGLQPDLTLVDVDLGDESGFDLARQLARTTVILISAYPEDDLEDLIAASPALGFLSKSDLSRTTISALLDRPPDP